jgi:hypothetical protein
MFNYYLKWRFCMKEKNVHLFFKRLCKLAVFYKGFHTQKKKKAKVYSLYMWLQMLKNKRVLQQKFINQKDFVTFCFLAKGFLI